MNPHTLTDLINTSFFQIVISESARVHQGRVHITVKTTNRHFFALKLKYFTPVYYKRKTFQWMSSSKSVAARVIIWLIFMNQTAPASFVYSERGRRTKSTVQKVRYKKYRKLPEEKNASTGEQKNRRNVSDKYMRFYIHSCHNLSDLIIKSLWQKCTFLVFKGFSLVFLRLMIFIMCNHSCAPVCEMIMSETP